jgi:hypothetical protein
MNYTPEVTANMVARYTNNPCKETVMDLAEELGKTNKSIIGKLSREGVYRKEYYTTKTGDDPITKMELTHEFSDLIDLECELLIGLEKTPKPVLKLIIEALKIKLAKTNP